MSGLIGMLEEGLAGIKAEEMIGNTEKVGKDEVVIGEVTSDELRRLFTFQEKHKEELEQTIGRKAAQLHESEDEGCKHNPETCPYCPLRAEFETGQAVNDSLLDLFWSAVRNSLPPDSQVKVMNSDCLGLRDGWKIVAWEEEDVMPTGIHIFRLSFPHDN